jgi:phosphatidylserine synthase 2
MRRLKFGSLSSLMGARRIVLGMNLLYFMLLSFLYWTDKSTARELIRYFDPSLGVPLPEKSYAEHCEFTPQNVWQGIDIFCVAHSVGWFAKAVVLRDHWYLPLYQSLPIHPLLNLSSNQKKKNASPLRFCWILSVGFEVMEYSLQHHLPNFAECWWDHWILDVCKYTRPAPVATTSKLIEDSLKYPHTHINVIKKNPSQ